MKRKEPVQLANHAPVKPVLVGQAVRRGHVAPRGPAAEKDAESNGPGEASEGKAATKDSDAVEKNGEPSANSDAGQGLRNGAKKNKEPAQQAGPSSGSPVANGGVRLPVAEAGPKRNGAEQNGHNSAARLTGAQREKGAAQSKAPVPSLEGPPAKKPSPQAQQQSSPKSNQNVPGVDRNANRQSSRVEKRRLRHSAECRRDHSGC